MNFLDKQIPRSRLTEHPNCNAPGYTKPGVCIMGSRFPAHNQTGQGTFIPMLTVSQNQPLNQESPSHSGKESSGFVNTRPQAILSIGFILRSISSTSSFLIFTNCLPSRLTNIKVPANTVTSFPLSSYQARFNGLPSTTASSPQMILISSVRLIS